ncbi:sensor histidine kinase [Roseivirga sp.]|uniref:sensor histidine kinase n=1 Tax=Roseivirga sp. TaxID=1964215 RepID=UPI003B8E92F1
MELILSKKHSKKRQLILIVVISFCFQFLLSYGSVSSPYSMVFMVGLIPITMVICNVFIFKLIPSFLLKNKLVPFITWSITTLLGSAILTLSFLIATVAFLPNFTADQLPPSTKNYPFLLATMWIIVAGSSFLSLWKHRQLTQIENLSLEKRLAEKEAAIKSQELSLLKNQLHPHFLFNSLNTIYSLALSKSKETPETVLKLSDLLDYTLYQVNQPMVEIKKELDYIRDYIDLEKTRFDDSLQITFEKHLDRDDLKMAPMLLMPFIENAFKHGKVLHQDQVIAIKLEVSNDQLEFNIRNSYDGKALNKGIGLQNIQERLKMLYPNRHALRIEQKEHIFEINLQIKGLKPVLNV